MSQGKYSKWRKWELSEGSKAAMKQQIALARDEPVWEVYFGLGNNFLYFFKLIASA